MANLARAIVGAFVAFGLWGVAAVIVVTPLAIAWALGQAIVGAWL